MRLSKEQIEQIVAERVRNYKKQPPTSPFIRALAWTLFIIAIFAAIAALFFR